MQISYKTSGNGIIRNSIWGIMSTIFQTLFVILFFVIIARKYNSGEFAQFLISTTVYQLVAAFSSMGLGQWFIRQYELEDDKIGFTARFLKTQAGLGFIFYFVNILLACIIYQDEHIRLLCLIFGANILFDNMINGLRSLNIAEFRQQNTAVILMIDGFLKLLVGCTLFISPFSSVILAVLLVLARMLTLGVFVKMGTLNSISLKAILKATVAYEDVQALILKNWRFMVIGSISIVYWRVANIIISKSLTMVDVADYEIAFRIFSVFQILPVVASATVYPQFIKYVNAGDFTGLKQFYNKLFFIYSIFAVVAYAFIYCYSDLLITVAFGKAYPGAIPCLQQMFLTFLWLPTVLLQANLLVALGLEKLDMWFNIISLFINVAGCFIGLYFFSSLSVINYSIQFSFLVFHICQDVSLVKRKLISLKHCLSFYAIIILTVFIYNYMTVHIHPYIFFITSSGLFISLSWLFAIAQKRKYYPDHRLQSVLSE